MAPRAPGNQLGILAAEVDNDALAQQCISFMVEASRMLPSLLNRGKTSRYKISALGGTLGQNGHFAHNPPPALF